MNMTRVDVENREQSRKCKKLKITIFIKIATTKNKLMFSKNKSYQVENDAKDDEYVGFGCCDYCLIGLSYFIGLLTFPLFVIMSIKIVKEYERAVIMRLGRISGGAKGPGLFWVLPCTDTIQIVDLRTVIH
jgi:erythrocyte band 7 integral membrane protein